MQRCLLSVSMIFLVFCSQVSADLIGINTSGDLISIDKNTGAGTLIGNTGLLGSDAMEFGIGGNLYVAAGSLIFDLDPVDLSSRLIRNLGNDGIRFVEDLAFSPGTSVLYGTADFNGSNGLEQAESLITIDLATAAPTFVGTFGAGYGDVDALGVSSEGDLFINNLLHNPDLGSVDAASGAASSIGFSGLQIIALEFDSSDELFGIQEVSGASHLVKIDTETGALTMVGSTGFSAVTGIAFSSVPEPHSALLLTAAMTCGLLRRRRNG